MGKFTHVFRKGITSAPDPGAVTTSTSCAGGTRNDNENVANRRTRESLFKNTDHRIVFRKKCEVAFDVHLMRLLYMQYIVIIQPNTLVSRRIV